MTGVTAPHPYAHAGNDSIDLEAQAKDYGAQGAKMNRNIESQALIWPPKYG